MARGPLITPSELAHAWEVFQREGTFQAAADAIGRAQSVVRRALLREYTGVKSAKVDAYARALDEVAGDLAATQRHAARRLRAWVRTAPDKELGDAVAALNDTQRALTTTRTAHAKLTGEHAADKIDANVNAQVVVLPPLENVRPADAQDPLAAEPRPSDEVSR